MLHTIRNIIDNDEKWRKILRGLNEEFYHQTVTTAQIENYMIKKSGWNLQPIFDQYLRAKSIPRLVLETDKKCLKYRFTEVIDGFEMPIKITVDGKEAWITPTTKLKEKKFRKPIQKVEVDRNFYINLDKKY